MAKVKSAVILIIGCLSFDDSMASVKDPTKPIFHSTTNQQTSTKKVNRKQQLTAIFLKKTNKQAIINEKLYNEGDYVGDKKLIKINSNSVILKNSEGVSRLTLVTSIKKLKK